MRLSVRTVLDAPAERVWREACTSRLLQRVCAPLQVFEPVAPPAFPRIWAEQAYLVRLWVLGCIPFGKHWIDISYPEPEQHRTGVYLIRDRGHGERIAVWDHLITIRARADGRCDYADDVRIQAGLMTPAVWCFAWLFYHHRQRVWRRLVAGGFEYDG